MVTELPALRGGLFALGAAVLFGVSTPLVQAFGAGVGSFTTAALLYAGAAVTGFVLRQPVEQEARIRLGDARSLLWMACFGAAIGPVALAWGLQRTSAASASLMLALEAVFTALLARLWYRETMDRRVSVAFALLVGGGVLLVWDRWDTAPGQAWGLLAVALATAAWGVDNALSRGVADRDPGQVVMAKGALGALATGALAWGLHEPGPSTASCLGLLGVGATGYGLSLRLYLLAQRRFGAARTGSVFAFAPFVGAMSAFVLGERGLSPGMVAGGASMAAGIALHLSERHAHEHLHDGLEHEHAHLHEDGHHLHTHAEMPLGAHSHVHRHDGLRHGHAHVPDEHHGHGH